MLRFILCLAFLTACGRHTPDEAPPSQIQEMQAIVDATPVGGFVRCDYATFAPLYELGASRTLDVAKLETPAGVWHRHFSPCFAQGVDDSKSEISRDSFISLGLWAMQYKLQDMAQRLVVYGEAHDWMMGAGPEALVWIGFMAPLWKKMAGEAALTAPSSEDAIRFLAGHRGHLIANYLLWRSGLYGKLSDVEVGVLKQLAAQTPESPYLSALVHSFTDGDYTDAINKARALRDCSEWWGSCVNSSYLALTLRVMKGFGK